jgi:exodeoxyribonuclease-5
LGVPEELVKYVAFTGKAATVLKQKGCAEATTAHKLLYWAKPLPNGKYIFEPRKHFETPTRVIVVDEVSMLPKSMWELLLSHHTYVLAMGDPGQLPPIDKSEANGVLDNPHVFLDEVMRQAQESEIIRLSMHVREGKPINTFEAAGAEVQIYNKNQLVDGMYSWADQILCATNKKREEINNFVRKMKGFGAEPEVGDKIISLHNHWDEYSLYGDWSLTNGCIGEIIDSNLVSEQLPYVVKEKPIQLLYTDMKIDNEDLFINLPIDYKQLKTGEAALTPQQIYRLKKMKLLDGPTDVYDFAYAYAITCWKAQGSEWNKVLFFEEEFPYDKETHKKYLYTGITRASKKLVVIKNA